MSDWIHRWTFDPTVGKLVATALTLIALYVSVKLAQRTLARYVTDPDARYRIRKFITFVGYAVALLVPAAIFSNKLAGFTVAFGVAGAGIAFALQEVIASVAGWLAILMGGFFRTGDRVQLGGIVGDVIDIGVLRSTLMECGQWVKGDLYNGRIVRIANSFVFKAPVFNYSGGFPFLWDEIIVPVKYGSDAARAREILERAAHDLVGAYAEEAQVAWKGMVRRFMIEDAQVEPMVSLVLNDNWMEFTLRYVVDFKRRRFTKDLLFSRLLKDFEATDGKVSFASATFQLVEAPVFDVRLGGGIPPMPPREARG